MSLSKYEFGNDIIDRNKSVIIQNSSKGTILPNPLNSRQYNEENRNIIQSNKMFEKLSEKIVRQNEFSSGILAAFNANIYSSSESDVVSIKEILLEFLKIDKIIKSGKLYTCIIRIYAKKINGFRNSYEKTYRFLPTNPPFQKKNKKVKAYEYLADKFVTEGITKKIGINEISSSYVLDRVFEEYRLNCSTDRLNCSTEIHDIGGVRDKNSEPISPSNEYFDLLEKMKMEFSDFNEKISRKIMELVKSMKKNCSAKNESYTRLKDFLKDKSFFSDDEFPLPLIENEGLI